ncbi:unnamed protein product [Cunninghamella blakesleeana]
MKYLQVCQVLYDYEARTSEEINIQENDTVYIIEKEDDDWWKAELKQVNVNEHGPIGLVPVNYLEEVTPIGKVRAEYDYDAQQEEELSFTENQEFWLIEQDNPNWYLVKQDNGEIGLVPSNYVQHINDNTAASTVETQASPAPTNIIPTQNIKPVAPPLPPITTTTAATASPQTPTIIKTPTYVVKNTPKEEDEAQSWSVHEYDVEKKKKKKGKGNLLVGNAMLCYGSETDKISPVQQYPILDVNKYLFDGKNLHIEIGGNNPSILDLQASSKSEAKAIVVKITDSRNLAQVAGTHINTSSSSSSSPSSGLNNNNSNNNNVAAPSSSKEPKWAISLYSFVAEGGEEISVDENQQILVIDDERDDGWWRIETEDGKSGIIPTSYVQFYENNDQQHDVRAPSSSVNATEYIDTAAHDEVEAYMKEHENKDLMRQKALQSQIEESERREQQRRLEEEEKQRKLEQRRREEEERERRRKTQEAAQRAELLRQQQMEEERLQRERSAKSSPSHSNNRTVSRSTSVRHDLPKPDADRLRTWTDRSGSFKVEAQFLGYSEGKLRLHKANGVKIDVPLEKMSAEDIRWVERRTDQPIGSISNRSAVDTNKEKSPEMPPRQVEASSSSRNNNNNNKETVTKKKIVNPNWDWFDWFMMIGIPMQEALIYSSAFKSDNLDDSDLEKLTHKQMKMLGLKESHVQRVERYIDTQKVEPLSDDEDNTNNNNNDKGKELERKKQIEEDEAFARKLQDNWDDSENNKGTRQKPNVSAPKNIHPDLLDFVGSDFTSSSSNETSLVKVNNEPSSSSTSNKNSDLIGFSDDAWAPRPLKETLPAQQPLQPKAAPSPVQNQIQSNNISSPPNTVQTPNQPVQQLAIASSPAPLQQQTPQQSTSLSASKIIDPTLHQWQNKASNNGFNQMNTRQNVTLNDISKQQEILKFQQQQRQQALIEQQQNMIMQQQQHIQNHQQQQSALLQQQQAQIQQQVTGFPANNNNGLVLYNNGSQIQQPQITGFVSQQLPLNTGFGMQQQMQSPAIINTPSVAAGQPIQQQQFMQSQPTGQHWNSSTPENPFGSSAISTNNVIQPQITGVQFSTPNPNAFTHSPLQQSSTPLYLQQLQPQMTGIAQPELSGARDKYAAFKTPDASVFTQSGANQFGQSGFPPRQGW